MISRSAPLVLVFGVACSAGGGDASGAGGVGSAARAGQGGGSGSSGSAGKAGSSGVGGGTAGSSGRGASGSGGFSGSAGAGGNAATGGGAGTGGSAGAGSGGSTGGAGAGGIRYVFVIAMENHDDTSIYGNSSSAPYINGTLMTRYARSANFLDPLPIGVPSEPHYLWMEAGTNAFKDHTFTNDDDPSSSNSTSSVDHLVNQIEQKGGLSWLSYQEGLDSSTGACPVKTSGFYAAKHNPFVFFQDITGNPPSASTARCTSHHRSLGSLSQDLKNGSVANYNFITPNQCNDMHGQFLCPSIDLVKPGDDWLRANLPDMISFCEAHNGVVFVVWDEGEGKLTIPFLAIGPGIKPGYVSSVTYTHGSLVKSVERIFGLPTLPSVASDADFADCFQPGAFP